ncbi:hypothetical protein [Pseudomonas gingeri]|uniref:Uncharacterized protein n=1 Tax=Pseudomonas gingeri TaxID=117681 RepID=A0A7Y7WN76_9PSED|nr:hypothetical protein [Pseudomonas gingeri]NWB84699.1 hypothetical protein [Pseudomonas gingeri]
MSVKPTPWHINAIADGIADAEAGNLTDLKIIKAKWVNRARLSAVAAVFASEQRRRR